MKYGIHAPNFGAFGDVCTLAGFAHEAEEAGWDGFFIWDEMLWTEPINQFVLDPTVALAAMAAATERIRLGALVTPVPRRRPWKLARELATLDHLSGGRMVMGVGLGGDDSGQFSAFGESAEDGLHAEQLDEALSVIAGLWSGEPFSYAGKHFQVNDVQFLPTPVQKPRIPVWTGGIWPNKRPFRRAAQWDGAVPLGKSSMLTPADIRDISNFIREHRANEDAHKAFDMVCIGTLPPDMNRTQQSELLAEYEEAGATWWLVDFQPLYDATVEQVRQVLRSGPPDG